MIPKKLTKKILEMANLDQKIRRLWIKNPSLYKRKLKETDLKNTGILKKIIELYGWPASHSAWLLVQHADHDLKFQKLCLSLMEENTADWAYLTDRILVNENKPQIYGTQFYEDSTGKLVPRSIKNINGLDERRKTVWLKSFKLYKKQMEKLDKYYRMIVQSDCKKKVVKVWKD